MFNLEYQVSWPKSFLIGALSDSDSKTKLTMSGAGINRSCRHIAQDTQCVICPMDGEFEMSCFHTSAVLKSELGNTFRCHSLLPQPIISMQITFADKMADHDSMCCPERVIRQPTQACLEGAGPKLRRLLERLFDEWSQVFADSKLRGWAVVALCSDLFY